MEESSLYPKDMIPKALAHCERPARQPTPIDPGRTRENCKLGADSKSDLISPVTTDRYFH